MSAASDALERGVLNLLRNCAEAMPGERLLILREDPALGYFGEGLAEAIARIAAEYGLSVSLKNVAFDPDVEELSVELSKEVANTDHILFLARLGDQLRFREMPAEAKPIVSYVLDRESLSSPFGTAHHGAFVALKIAFNRLFSEAAKIHVTCPLGTDFKGSMPPATGVDVPDVGIKRYPASVFAPLDAACFVGKIAVAHLLVGTGSRYYKPYGLQLNTTLFAHIEGGRLRRWEGDVEEVTKAEAHYAHVANLYGIAADFVHSWHAGIHPGCAYSGAAAANYERWSGSAFGNPRLLHFHTCGAYAPGEICWNVVDPTIVVDGVVVWDRGRIVIDHVPGAADIVAGYAGLRALFDNPAMDIGLAPEGLSQ